MRVLVLGGDGFCGWPTALYLKKQGHDVTIADNGLRRTIDRQAHTASLTPIDPARKRTGCADIELDYRDLSWPDLMRDTLLRGYDAILHFAEIRSAPYSMKSGHTKRGTVANNTRVTHNLLSTLVDLGMHDTHVVHLGTMGRYGYGGRIPEGYYEDGTPPPYRPGSVYHMTKCFDSLMFDFYAKNDGLRITDLHQGIVWGTQTTETLEAPELINRFDYCGDWGTVLNRFLMQAVLGYPLTVYGTGGQTRAFIHISDMVRCIEIALHFPPDRGERPLILNQMTETHSVLDLATMVSALTDTPIEFLDNPRKEAASNDLDVDATGLIELGLDPTYLEEGLLTEIMQSVEPYIDRADKSTILPTSKW